MKRKKQVRSERYGVLLLRFWRVMLGELAAANLIGSIFEVPHEVWTLTVRIGFFILSASFYIIFDKILYERFE